MDMIAIQVGSIGINGCEERKSEIQLNLSYLLCETTLLIGRQSDLDDWEIGCLEVFTEGCEKPRDIRGERGETNAFFCLVLSLIPKESLESSATPQCSRAKAMPGPTPHTLPVSMSACSGSVATSHANFALRRRMFEVINSTAAGHVALAGQNKNGLLSINTTACCYKKKEEE
nr:hypothetical protein Iba_chr13eCG5980 [Ipomoea batatas]